MFLLELKPRNRDQTSPGKAALWFAAYLVVALAGGALLGYFLVRHSLDAGDGFWHDLIVDKGARGPARVLRRVQTVLAVLLAPFLLKKIGWRGFSDLGWSGRHGSPDPLPDFRKGFVIGLAMMGMLLVFGLASGACVWNPEDRWFWPIAKGFLLTGLAVGLLEETMMRGALYRSMARTWTPWVGAVVSSAVFGWVHFLKASPESFEHGALAVLRSSLIDGLLPENTGIKWLNLFLLGLVFCRMVECRGHIWMAVGFHASAIGMIAVFGRLTDIVMDVPRNPWVGHHTGFIEGRLCAFLLLGLLLWSVFGWQPAREKSRVRY